MPASAGVREPFFMLQERQAVTMLDGSWLPGRSDGIACSSTPVGCRWARGSSGSNTRHV